MRVDDEDARCFQLISHFASYFPILPLPETPNRNRTERENKRSSEGRKEEQNDMAGQLWLGIWKEERVGTAGN